jgi:hypothetical protein
MHSAIFITAKRQVQRIGGEGFTFFMAFLMLAPWTVINLTIDTAEVAMREARSGFTTHVYASSYSSVTTSVTANGTTVVTSSSDSSPTSAAVSVSQVMNGVDGADGVRGTDGADGMHGIDGKDGGSINDGVLSVSTKENDEARIQILRMLIEKLEQLLALLKGNN